MFELNQLSVYAGAGKSTLSRLLFRFFDVSQGQVLLNGYDLRDLTQKSLRQALGIVPQDTTLFNDTMGMYFVAVCLCISIYSISFA